MITAIPNPLGHFTGLAVLSGELTTTVLKFKSTLLENAKLAYNDTFDAILDREPSDGRHSRFVCNSIPLRDCNPKTCLN